MNEVMNTVIPQVSPPLGAVLFLNMVAFLLVKTGVDRKYAPWITAATGAVAWPFVSEPGQVGYAVASPIIGQVMMGFFIGATSVWTHQTILKPVFEKFKTKEDEYEKADKNSPPDNPVGGPIV